MMYNWCNELQKVYMEFCYIFVERSKLTYVKCLAQYLENKGKSEKILECPCKDFYFKEFRYF